MNNDQELGSPTLRINQNNDENFDIKPSPQKQIVTLNQPISVLRAYKHASATSEGPPKQLFSTRNKNGFGESQMSLTSEFSSPVLDK